MATTLPYTAPYAQAGAGTRTRLRQAPRVDTGSVQFAILCIAGAVFIALAQLYLTGEASDTMNRLSVLEKENALIQAQIDEQQAQIERLRSPRRIEADAARLGLKPFTNIQYMNP